MLSRGRYFPGRTSGPWGSVRTVAAVAVLEALKRRLDALQPSLAADLTALAGRAFRALTGAREWEEREFRRHITDWEMECYFEII